MLSRGLSAGVVSSSAPTARRRRETLRLVGNVWSLSIDAHELIVCLEHVELPTFSASTLSLSNGPRGFDSASCAGGSASGADRTVVASGVGSMAWRALGALRLGGSSFSSRFTFLKLSRTPLRVPVLL